ncbi:hypothetical protein Prudu_017789 [Prunus dulcis]|uniref:Uncharacterized protein n=1 Tax=Prunus dulcis TaxID=3755 RepID=A0A4Y1RPR3_PRUDU|nr:hypothetical protein Prudu_017789 [Prunus dulcis]
MSDMLDDPAFWLPTQILDDDDLPAMDLGSKTNSKTHHKSFGLGFDVDASKALFPFDFPYGGYGAFGVSSDLSSPVESVVGSSETESDEEDYLAELTRQMARSTFEKELKHSDAAFGSDNSKSWVVSGSPQSTLCPAGSGCGCGLGSSRGSPNAHSPPATWDLLHAAAGEVAKMHIDHSRGFLGPPRKPSPPVPAAPLSSNPNNPDVGFYFHQQSLSHKHLQATQAAANVEGTELWGLGSAASIPTAAGSVPGSGSGSVSPNGPEQSEKQRSQQSASGFVAICMASSATSQQQQQYQKNGSGMRAVFLGTQNAGAKRECAGTGVFLPRQIGTQSETRKKTGCSTVLVPARVVQALKLNIDDMCAPQQPHLQRRFNASYNPEYDIALRLRSNNGAISQQRRNVIRPQPPQVVG